MQEKDLVLVQDRVAYFCRIEILSLELRAWNRDEISLKAVKTGNSVNRASLILELVFLGPPTLQNLGDGFGAKKSR